jgi:hypothetical protein
MGGHSAGACHRRRRVVTAAGGRTTSFRSASIAARTCLRSGTASPPFSLAQVSHSRGRDRSRSRFLGLRQTTSCGLLKVSVETARVAQSVVTQSAASWRSSAGAAGRRRQLFIRPCLTMNMLFVQLTESGVEGEEVAQHPAAAGAGGQDLRMTPDCRAARCRGAPGSRNAPRALDQFPLLLRPTR